MHRKIGFTLVAALVVASVGTATVTRAAGGGGAAGGGAASTGGPRRCDWRDRVDGCQWYT